MITTDSRFISEVLRGLVRIESINPTLDARGSGERAIAEYTANVFDRLGLDVRRHEPEPGRISVVGLWKGRGGGRSLMLNAHYDTVGVDGMEEPFSGETRQGRLFGRGAYDMKGSLAACMGAVEALRRDGHHPAGDLLIAAVADEEHSSLGTQDLVKRYAVDGAIVTEPTSLRLCLAHKGFVWLDVTTFGRAAHGSRPDLGIDANARMGRVLTAIEALNARLAEGRKHPLLGPGSMHAALLRGGTGLSTYSAECRLSIERRTVPGESEDGVRGEIQSVLDSLARADPSFTASLEVLLSRPPFEARPGSPLVNALRDAAHQVLGHEPEPVGETPWMDSALLAEAGVDTVVMGPHGTGAHAAVEWVDLESVEALARILAQTVLDYCA